MEPFPIESFEPARGPTLPFKHSYLDYVIDQTSTDASLTPEFTFGAQLHSASGLLTDTRLGILSDVSRRILVRGEMAQSSRCDIEQDFALADGIEGIACLSPNFIIAEPCHSPSPINSQPPRR